MLPIISALVSGLIFGAGLIISEMVNPQKVLGFLDLFGDWDPSLALVMSGALLTLGSLHLVILKRPAPILETDFHIAKQNPIDKRLIIGAALFGLGWGLLGFCPGPALMALSYLVWPAFIFVIGMAIGMRLADLNLREFLNKKP